MPRRDYVRELRTRAVAEAAVEVRGPVEAPVFVGRPILYNSRTAIGNPLSWGFYEQIDPGAASKTLKEGDARFLVDHETSMPISRVSAGTLRLTETDDGVNAESDLNTRKSYVADLVENLRDGTVTGMSFGFYVVKDEWGTENVETSDGNSVEVDVRTIKEIRLLEVSAVTFPAYEDTEAGLRKQAAAVRSIRTAKRHPLDLAELLRDADTDADDDPNTLIAAVDAAIDEALDLHAAGEDEQAWALITSADVTVDKVLALLGIPDPDEDARSSEPADATRTTTTEGQPGETTGLRIAHLAMRHEALASRYGLGLSA